MATIELQQLTKRFADFTAVQPTDLRIPHGAFFVLLGPSGCGKTTTLRMIAGLEAPSSGRILLDDADVTDLRPAKRDIAFVFQMYALYPHMNVRKNLAYPLRSQGASGREIKARIAEVARLLRIEPLLNRSVGGLSSGDRQRVALGRAIIRRPKAFLMDEPLGALDTEFRQLMCEELRLLHDRIDATTVYVTHDQLEAMAMADQIAVMNHGVVQQVASPRAIYRAPATRFVAAFIGSPAMNFLPAIGPAAPGTTALRVNGAALPVPSLAAPLTAEGGEIGVRPEHVRLRDDGALRGRIFGVEYMGARQIVTVDTDVGRLKVMAPNTVPAAIGDTVGLAFATETLSIFDGADGKALPLLREPAAPAQEAAHG